MSEGERRERRKGMRKGRGQKGGREDKKKGATPANTLTHPAPQKSTGPGTQV